MKFTKTEIDLCKKIKEKKKKEVLYGDWFYSENFKEVVCNIPFINPIRDREILNRDKSATPLWTIEDCLGFLEEKKVPVGILPRRDKWAVKRGWKWQIRWGTPIDHPLPWGGSINSKTVLEGLLPVVLTVLERKNG